MDRHCRRLSVTVVKAEPETSIVASALSDEFWSQHGTISVSVLTQFSSRSGQKVVYTVDTLINALPVTGIPKHLHNSTACLHISSGLHDVKRKSGASLLPRRPA